MARHGLSCASMMYAHEEDCNRNVRSEADTAGDRRPGNRPGCPSTKQFRGGLEAASKGEMITGMTGVKGSAGYVAIERVSGTLNGRKGAFTLQHNGTLTRGAPTLSVTVVPDSGTGELAGLSGKMTIDIAGGHHAYSFEYSLSETE